MTRTHCERLARANVRRAIWQGSRSRIPFALELVAGIALWCAFKIADRVAAHIKHAKEASRCAW